MDSPRYARAKLAKSLKKHKHLEREAIKQSQTEALSGWMRNCGNYKATARRVFRCNRWTCAPGNPFGCCAHQVESRANSIYAAADEWLASEGRRMYLFRLDHIGSTTQGLQEVFSWAKSQSPTVRPGTSGIEGSVRSRQTLMVGDRWAVREWVLVPVSGTLSRTVELNLRQKFSAGGAPFEFEHRDQASGAGIVMAGDHGGRLVDTHWSVRAAGFFGPCDGELSMADLFQRHLKEYRENDYRRAQGLTVEDPYSDVLAASKLRRFESGSSRSAWGDIRDRAFAADQRRERIARRNEAKSFEDEQRAQLPPDELALCALKDPRTQIDEFEDAVAVLKASGVPIGEIELLVEYGVTPERYRRSSKV